MNVSELAPRSHTGLARTLWTRTFLRTRPGRVSGSVSLCLRVSPGLCLCVSPGPDLQGLRIHVQFEASGRSLGDILTASVAQKEDGGHGSVAPVL